MVKIQEGQGKYKVTLQAIKSGDDLTIIIYGGEKPHIGAVAVSIPRPSLKKVEITSASTSVFTLIGHKEDDLAKKIADDIAKITQRTTVVIAGLHINEANSQDIDILVRNTENLVSRLSNTFKDKIT